MKRSGLARTARVGEPVRVRHGGFLLCIAVVLLPAIQADTVIDGRSAREWLRLLKHGEPAEKEQAAEVAGRLANREAVVPLIAILREPVARLAALEALRRLGPDAKSASEALLALRKDEDARVRRAALAAAISVGVDVVPYLVRDLKEGDARLRAIGSLSWLGPRAARGIPSLAAILGYVVDPLPRGLHRSDVRERHALRMAEAAKNRRAAARALAHISDGHPAAVAALRKALEDPDRAVRRESALALAWQGTACVPAFTEALRLDDDEIVTIAVRVLQLHGPDARDSVTLLRRLLRRREPLPMATRLAGPAADAIERSLGLLARATVGSAEERAQALAELVAYGDGVTGVVVDALGARDLQQTTLRCLLERQTLLQPADTDFDLERLPRPRLRASDLLPALMRVATQGDPATAALALEALGRLGPGASPALGVLLDAARAPDLAVRSAAVQAIARIGPAAAPAIPALIDALGEAALRDAAVTGLVAIGPRAVPALVQALEASASAPGALLALGHLGPEAWRAADRLRALTEAGEPALRPAAKEALARISARVEPPK